LISGFGTGAAELTAVAVTAEAPTTPLDHSNSLVVHSDFGGFTSLDLAHDQYDGTNYQKSPA